MLTPSFTWQGLLWGSCTCFPRDTRRPRRQSPTQFPSWSVHRTTVRGCSFTRVLVAGVAAGWLLSCVLASLPVTPRERVFGEALRLWAGGRMRQAAGVLEAHLLSVPRDALAIRCLHDTYFFLGSVPFLGGSMSGRCAHRRVYGDVQRQGQHSPQRGARTPGVGQGHARVWSHCRDACVWAAGESLVRCRHGRGAHVTRQRPVGCVGSYVSLSAQVTRYA
mgnify:CR=1 FL=1